MQCGIYTVACERLCVSLHVYLEMECVWRVLTGSSGHLEGVGFNAQSCWPVSSELVCALAAAVQTPQPQPEAPYHRAAL